MLYLLAINSSITHDYAVIKESHILGKNQFKTFSSKLFKYNFLFDKIKTKSTAVTFLKVWKKKLVLNVWLANTKY